jgi:transcription elongation factor GreA-like protein
MRNLEQDINVLSEQLRFSQKEITTRKELEEQLRDQYEKEIRRLENDLKIYKESAQGSMSLCDENDTLKRQVAELRSGRK